MLLMLLFSFPNFQQREKALAELPMHITHVLSHPPRITVTRHQCVMRGIRTHGPTPPNTSDLLKEEGSMQEIHGTGFSGWSGKVCGDWVLQA